MNRVLLRTIMIVGILIPSLSWGYSNMAPHSSYGCGSCHTTHSVYGVNAVKAYTNVCLTCHSPGKLSTSDGPITPFTGADFANPFKTYTATRAGSIYQTSHKWFGSDNVPAAGALPPVGAYPTQLLNRVGDRIDLPNTLSCSRCHDLYNPEAQAFVTRANDFLRKDNTDDGLCQDCHRSRNNTDATKGSHPVNITYASARHPENLYATPQSTNPANYTASLNLKSGKVQCTTCHKAHFADSNAFTFDNRSSARFGLLSTSSGKLLRTGMRGTTPDARNICTNCHINKLAHNGAGQGVQCIDCHGGHVDLGDNSVPNQYLVNRLINFSSAKGAKRNVQVFFQYTGASRWNLGGTNGICVACHTVPAPGSYNGKIYPAQHSSSDPKVCVQCHYHTSTAGSFSGGCSTCHGFPPQANTTGGPNGKVAGYALDESQTKHKEHSDAGYTCIECHYDPQNLPAQHRNGLTNDVFNPAHIAASKASYGGLTPRFRAADRSCSSVYCHSNGKPNGGVAFKTYTTPSWFQGASLDCDSCHGSAPATNSHAKHLGYGFSCQVCHSATVSGNSTITDKSKHADTHKDVAFSRANLNFDLSGSNCANVYCHSNAGGAKVAPPAWTSAPSDNCTAICHATDALNTGAHQKHLAPTGYGPKLSVSQAPASCNNCHAYPGGHVNGSIQSPANCTAVCHPNGLGSATWTGTGRVACESCHTGTPAYVNGYAPSKALFATVGHGSKGTTCSSCHDNTTDHIGVPGGTKRLTDATNTLCTTCHATNARQGWREYLTHFTAKGVANAKCSTCHDTHGSGNIAALREVISFGPRSSAVITIADRSSGLVNTETNIGFCQVCHTNTNHYRRGVEEADHPTTDCLNCHKHTESLKGGACNGCHGYPPVPRNIAVSFGSFNNWTSAAFESYSGGGGAHLIPGHIPPGAKASEGWQNCSACHNSGQTSPTPYHVSTTPVRSHVDSVTVKVDSSYVFNADRFINYSGAKLVNAPQSNKSGRCFNVSCHLAPSPRWSTER